MLLHQPRAGRGPQGLALVENLAPVLKTRVRVVQAGQRAQQHGFARAHRPQQRSDSLGWQGEIQLRQNDALPKGNAKTIRNQAR